MVQLGFMAKVKDFASINLLSKICNEFENVDVEVQHDRYIVDGKSILGLHSINLFDDFLIVFVSHDTFTEVELNKIKKIREKFGI